MIIVVLGIIINNNNTDMILSVITKVMNDIGIFLIN